MSLLMIRRFPDPILRQKSEPLVQLNDDDRRLALDMIDTMYFAEGVGLAANQVGIDKRIIIMSPTNKRGEETVIFNPEILTQSGRVRDKEGCLSVPGITGEVTRFNRLTVKGLTLEGKPKTWELEGFPAVIVQHEVDHINGVLFIDRLKYWHKRKANRLLRQQQQ